MAELDHLHEASILENLRRCFLAKRPYTYSGPIAIAVNPSSDKLSHSANNIQEMYPIHYIFIQKSAHHFLRETL